MGPSVAAKSLNKFVSAWAKAHQVPVSGHVDTATKLLAFVQRLSSTQAQAFRAELEKSTFATLTSQVFADVQRPSAESHRELANLARHRPVFDVVEESSAKQVSTLQMYQRRVGGHVKPSPPVPTSHPALPSDDVRALHQAFKSLGPTSTLPAIEVPGFHPQGVERVVDENEYWRVEEGVERRYQAQGFTRRFVRFRNSEPLQLATVLTILHQARERIAPLEVHWSAADHAVILRTRGGSENVLVISQTQGTVDGCGTLVSGETFAALMSLSGIKDLPILSTLVQALEPPPFAESDLQRAQRWCAECEERFARFEVLKDVVVGPKRYVQGEPVLAPEAFPALPVEKVSGPVSDVPMGGFAVGRYGAGPSGWLGTNGMGPCYSVTLYDPTTRTGALTHSHGGTNIAASLAQLVAAMKREGADVRQLRATVFGGQMDQVEHPHLKVYEFRRYEELTQALAEFGISLTKSHWGVEHEGSYYLDLETGNTYRDRAVDKEPSLQTAINERDIDYAKQHGLLQEALFVK